MAIQRRAAALTLAVGLIAAALTGCGAKSVATSVPPATDPSALKVELKQGGFCWVGPNTTHRVRLPRTAASADIAWYPGMNAAPCRAYRTHLDGTQTDQLLAGLRAVRPLAPKGAVVSCGSDDGSFALVRFNGTSTNPVVRINLRGCAWYRQALQTVVGTWPWDATAFLSVTPDRGPRGTPVTIKIADCPDPDHALSYNDGNVAADSPGHLSRIHGIRLPDPIGTATLTFRIPSNARPHGTFYLQCGLTDLLRTFTVGAQPLGVSYPRPPGPDSTFVQRYLDAVVAGQCTYARTMMLSPQVKDPAGRPSPNAQAGNGLCGLTKTGQITIDGWRWGPSGYDGSGDQNFSVALIFHVTSGHIAPTTSWTGYAVPAGWSAYQLPMYSSDSGDYVAGAPTR